MQVDLPPALAEFVRHLVSLGRYADEADVVRDALRRMVEQDLDPETGVPIALLRAEFEATRTGPRSGATVLEVFDHVVARANSVAK